MQIFDFIRQRMHNMDFDSNFVVESEVIDFTGAELNIDASNAFYYLYEVIDYTGVWRIDADNDTVLKQEFIIDNKLPSGILELTGNIKFTSAGPTPNKFFFYKCTPQRILPPAPLPDPRPETIETDTNITTS